MTARGTRAVREREELLSVFEDPAVAEEVLGELIGARLLTSFDASERGSGDATQRIEVIHESLLSAWPRLVRWQTQDADGAQLRDQLRQAARLWQERGRPEELLWTGASFLDYRAWRERYPGGLTALEADFTDAMVALSGRRRRRRRLAVGAAFAVLLAALATFGTLWRNSEAARKQAEASKLLALGRLELDEDPTAAVAYALKSLELTDTPEARRFVLEALWRGPWRLVVNPKGSGPARFSPDGRWLPWSPVRGPVLADSEVLWVQPASGGEPHELRGHGGSSIVLSPDSRLLVSERPESTVLDVRSFPEGATLRTLELDGQSVSCFTDDGRSLLTLTLTPGRPPASGPEWELRLWPMGDQGSRVLGRVPLSATVDERGRWLAWARGPGICLQRVDELGRSAPRHVLQHDRGVLGVRLQPGGGALGFVDVDGEPYLVRPGDRPRPLPGWPEKTAVQIVRFNGDGSLLAAAARDNLFRLWDLTAPRGGLPLLVQPRESTRPLDVGFDPSSRWLVTAAQTAGTAIWPLRRRHPRVLPTDGSIVGDLAFTPDGRSLVAGSSTTVWLWPLAGQRGESRRPLLEGRSRISRVKLDSSGRRVVAGFNGGEVMVRDLDGGPIRRLEGFRGRIDGLTFSHDGRFVAAAGGLNDDNEGIIRVWDLETGEVRVLNPEGGQLNWFLDATARGELVSSGPTGVRVWSFRGGEPRLLHAGSCEAVLEQDDRHVLVWCDDPWGGARHDLVDGTSQPVDLRSHPRAIWDLAVDPKGRTVVTAGPDTLVRVGPVTGEEPHLLMGSRAGQPQGCRGFSRRALDRQRRLGRDHPPLAHAGRVALPHATPRRAARPAPVPHQRPNRRGRRVVDRLRPRQRSVPGLGESAGVVAAPVSPGERPVYSSSTPSPLAMRLTYA